MALRCVLRACGILGCGLNGETRRLVLAIAAEATLQEESETSESLEPPAPSAFDWLPSVWKAWGHAKGGLCTQAFLAVLLAAGRWQSLSLQQLRLRMQAALQRSGLEAAVTLRCSRELQSCSLDQALSSDSPAAPARALLIGICYNDDEELRLEGSWNDVQDMRSWLLREGIVREEDLRVLSDRSGDMTMMPSRSNILTHLEWLLCGENRCSESAARGCCSGELPDRLADLQLFLLFAGHGDHAELLPSDWRKAGPIREREVSVLLDDLLPEGARLVCIFDCCDSSQMLSSLLRYRA